MGIWLLAKEDACSCCVSVRVPLDKVHEEWQQYRGRNHLQTVGLHFHIYRDVFGTLFQPRGFMRVVYGAEDEVHRGNIITAEKVHLMMYVLKFSSPPWPGYDINLMMYNIPIYHIFCWKNSLWKPRKVCHATVWCTHHILTHRTSCRMFMNTYQLAKYAKHEHTHTSGWWSSHGDFSPKGLSLHPPPHQPRWALA